MILRRMNKNEQEDVMGGVSNKGYRIGDRIYHNHYGYGTVKRVVLEGMNIVVRFDEPNMFGKRLVTLADAFPHMYKIPVSEEVQQ